MDRSLSFANKMAVAAFSRLIICRFGIPAIIHSDQGREFDAGVVSPVDTDIPISYWCLMFVHR